MRVIAGSCRSMPLKTVPGSGTRPTTDRIKETLFNILQSSVPNAVVADVFAGSGALGIEALSRGSRFAWFSDADRKAVQVIRENLEFTRLKDSARVLHMNYTDAIRTIASVGVCPDIVFLDPPYGKGLIFDALKCFRENSCADENTLFVAEASCEEDFGSLEEIGFVSVREKKYKTNKHVFIKMKLGETV